MPPSSSLGNPFNDQKRNPDTPAFFETVLGKKGTGRRRKSPPVEDFGAETDFVLSAEDQKRIEDERIFSEIITRESRALRKFFGKEIVVHPLPKQATAERILEWRRLGLELHYLPSISMAEIKRDADGIITDVEPKKFPGWKEKPGEGTPDRKYDIDFFDEVKSGDFDPSAVSLPGAWILVDSHEKPHFDNQYVNDPLAPALEGLRKEKIIADFKIKGSRFNLSLIELKDPKVLEAFAKALNLHTIPGLAIDIPRVIEFNILGNIHYRQWDRSQTAVWLSDTHRSQVLYGGSSFYGGLSHVGLGDLTHRGRNLGFLVIGRFS
ncbi:MAG TPA: hypothetical protein VFQ60_00030 [Patescibacteria group bacterium]|nr:hypothetical protein [Patescibacteria group bacterium]